MSDIDTLPVTPLSEHARQRIIDNVVDEVAFDKYRQDESAPLRSAHRYWFGIGLSAAAGAALVVALLFVLRPGGSSPKAQGVAQTGEPTRVAAGDAASTVTVGTSTLTVEARSSVVVTGDDDRGIEVSLENGTVVCQVAPRRGRPPFQVVAGHVRVVVVGTEFAVSRKDQVVSVVVRSGVVRVIAAGKETVLQADGRWSSDERKPVKKIPKRAQVKTTKDSTVPSLQPTQLAPRKTRVTRRRASAKPRRTPVKKTPNGDGGKVQPNGDKGKVEPKRSDEASYRRAALLERSKPAAAIALYRQVENGGGSWAASALFARARLQLERGRSQIAKRLLSRYLRLYPRGANAAMATRLLNKRK